MPLVSSEEVVPRVCPSLLAGLTSNMHGYARGVQRDGGLEGEREGRGGGGVGHGSCCWCQPAQRGSWAARVSANLETSCCCAGRRRGSWSALPPASWAATFGRWSTKGTAIPAPTFWSARWPRGGCACGPLWCAALNAALSPDVLECNLALLGVCCAVLCCELCCVLRVSNNGGVA